MVKETTYNKLVRDRIPEILTNKKSKCRTRILSDEEFQSALTDKLQEEVAEYLCSKTPSERVEELADVLEVIMALLKLEGLTLQDLEQVREEKLQNRGGFSQKIFLEKAVAVDLNEDYTQP